LAGASIDSGTSLSLSADPRQECWRAAATARRDDQADRRRGEGQLRAEEV